MLAYFRLRHIGGIEKGSEQSLFQYGVWRHLSFVGLQQLEFYAFFIVLNLPIIVFLCELSKTLYRCGLE